MASVWNAFIHFRYNTQGSRHLIKTKLYAEQRLPLRAFTVGAYFYSAALTNK